MIEPINQSTSVAVIRSRTSCVPAHLQLPISHHSHRLTFAVTVAVTTVIREICEYNGFGNLHLCGNTKKVFLTHSCLRSYAHLHIYLHVLTYLHIYLHVLTYLHIYLHVLTYTRNRRPIHERDNCLGLLLCRSVRFIFKTRPCARNTN